MIEMLSSFWFWMSLLKRVNTLKELDPLYLCPRVWRPTAFLGRLNHKI